MKKLAILLFAGLLVLGVTMPALAEVEVYGEIDKDKVIDVYQDVDIYKDINIDVTIDLTPSKGAQADSVVNQGNFYEFACENCAEKIATIYNSLNTNTGILNVNQAVGNFNNQGNVVSLAVDVFGGSQPPPPGSPGDGFANAETAVGQINGGNLIGSINILFRSATLDTSILNNKGLVGVNQSAGNINNQLNVITMAVAIQGNSALTEADLGQKNVGAGFLDDEVPLSYPQVVYEHDTLKNPLITNSINNNTGIVGVNQTVGNMANQANIANLAAFTSNAPAAVTLPNF